MKFNSADKDVIALKTIFWASIVEIAAIYPSLTFLSCVQIWRQPGNIEINPEFLNYSSYLLEANAHKQIGCMPLIQLPFARIIT